MIKPRLSLWVGLTWAALSVVLWPLAGCGKHAASEGDAAEEAPIDPVPVQVARAELRTLRPTLELVGTTVPIPERVAAISAQLGGWVQKLAVVEGQSVAAGDVLIRLDARTAQTDVDRSKAAVAEKEAVLARLKRGFLPQELEGASQDRDKARAAADGLRTEMAALKELLDRREISPIHYETKAKALQAADAALASAEAHLKLLEEGTRSEMLDEAQALLDMAKADSEHSQLALDLCTITSPIDGMVVQLLARQGQFFDRAAPLVTVIDLSEIFVQLRIPSVDFALLRVGAPVDVVATALPGRTFSGAIARISGAADPLSGNITVFVAVKNDGQALRPGFGCQAHIWLPEIEDALSIPVSAVADNAGTPVVTLIRNGKAQETEVKLGTQTHDFAQVVEGLSVGDLVATAGGYGLPEGCPVQIVSDSGTNPRITR
jgi:multidrug efflux pump subunit AcrA (membrane-fusion protein)